MELLAIGVDVAVLGVDVTPLLFGIGPLQKRLVGLLACGTFVLGLSLRFLGLFLLHVRVRGVGKEGGQSHELGMAGTVAGDIGGIHAPGNDPPVVDEYTSYRCLVGLQRQAGLQGGPVSTTAARWAGGRNEIKNDRAVRNVQVQWDSLLERAEMEEKHQPRTEAGG